MTYRITISALITLILLPSVTFAHGDPPDPLKGVKVPATPGLVSGSNRIVVDKKAAIQLGKALFWDASVGSDGVACATCHFHAGADRRTRNQLDTGVLHAGADTATSFEPTLTGGAGGPDYQLKQGDFPLMKFADPADKYSPVTVPRPMTWSLPRGPLWGIGTDGRAARRPGSLRSSPDALFHPAPTTPAG